MKCGNLFKIYEAKKKDDLFSGDKITTWMKRVCVIRNFPTVIFNKSKFDSKEFSKCINWDILNRIPTMYYAYACCYNVMKYFNTYLNFIRISCVKIIRYPLFYLFVCMCVYVPLFNFSMFIWYTIMQAFADRITVYVYVYMEIGFVLHPIRLCGIRIRLICVWIFFLHSFYFAPSSFNSFEIDSILHI